MGVLSARQQCGHPCCWGKCSAKCQHRSIVSGTSVFAYGSPVWNSLFSTSPGVGRAHRVTALMLDARVTCAIGPHGLCIAG